MAGPCAVESEEQLLAAAKEIKAAGAQILRGGCLQAPVHLLTFQGWRKRA